jgi:hypothetical protein
MGHQHSIIAALLLSAVSAQDSNSRFIFEVYRKVTAPEEGEEIYMYICAVLIGLVSYFIHSRWEEWRTTSPAFE